MPSPHILSHALRPRVHFVPRYVASSISYHGILCPQHDYFSGHIWFRSSRMPCALCRQTFRPSLMPCALCLQTFRPSRMPCALCLQTFRPSRIPCALCLQTFRPSRIPRTDFRNSFTDGSKSDNGVAAAALTSKNNHNCSTRRLPPRQLYSHCTTSSYSFSSPTCLPFKEEICPDFVQLFVSSSGLT